MAAGDHYRLRMIGSLRGSKVEFGLHFLETIAAGGAPALGAHWAANMTTLVTGATSVEVNWDNVIVSDVRPDGPESAHVSLTQPLPGLITGDCLPGQNAAVIQLPTGRKGRASHGRIFVPGLSEASTASGLVFGTQLTALGAMANGLENFYGPSGIAPGFRMEVYSPEQLTPPRVRPFKARPGVMFNAIVDSRVDPIIRTQRRRAIGVGR